MHPKDAAEITNSVDPDQTAPLGAVWSGSALFAQTCLSKNLGTLRYASLKIVKAHNAKVSFLMRWLECKILFDLLKRVLIN